ncbi:MAG: hypothetical protein QXS76_04905 [Candidatus Bathyarchaeia archaeon]
MSGVEPLRIEVSGIDELVRIASTLHASVINVDEERKIAFTFLMPIASLTPIIYFARLNEVPGKRFAHLNRITGRIRFSDEVSAEPNEMSVIFIRVKAGELFPQL